MNTLLEKKYINKILANKELLISELVDEFGEQYRPLLNERFDKIKFVFFTSLRNMRRYLMNKYSYIAANNLTKFIKKNGILNDVYVDDSFKDICGYTIESSEEDLFYSIFDTRFLDFNFEDKHKKIFGIFSFDLYLDYDYLNSCAQHRNISPIEFIRNNRCDFLRNIGKYPKNYSNEMIYNDCNYLSLCHLYEELMKEYNNILKGVKLSLKKDINIFNKIKDIRSKLFINSYKKMLEELIIYLNDEDRKKVESCNYTLDEIEFLDIFFNQGQSLNDESMLESLNEEENQKLLVSYYGENNEKEGIREYVKEVREKVSKIYNKQILETFTFETNFDISDIEIDNDISTSDHILFATFEQEDGVEKARLIFFDPYACEEEYLDIHLRHELRHSLTSSVRRENDLDIVKVGNAEYVYSEDKLVNVNNEFYNELLTQQKALENTKRSYQNGIYILSPKGVSFPNELTSGYDEYLQEFNKIYTVLPQDTLVSQIELDNKNLYSFISQDEIKQLEERLHDHGSIPQDAVDTILSRNKESKLKY